MSKQPSEIKGRRLSDCLGGTDGSFIPWDDDPQPGDYWRVLEPPDSHPPGPENLTGTIWGICGPVEGQGIAVLSQHTVREHEDGTISVRPGDGSSNSILTRAGTGSSWHGYIERGVWREA